MGFNNFSGGPHQSERLSSS